MKQRLLKAGRAVKVQQQLHKMAEVKLSEIGRKITAVRDDEAILLETLNKHDQLQGLFVAARAKRLQGLAVLAAQLEAAKSAQQQATFEKGMKVKRAEKMAGALKEEAQRFLEKKTFLEILDRMSSKKDASLP
jgi:hypothetical protein